MLNLNDHLLNGELAGGDGKPANIFDLYSNYSIHCERDALGLDEIGIHVFNDNSPLNCPVACAYFFSDETGITIGSNTYVHESLLDGRVDGQLFLLQADLAFKVRNDLLEIPEGHDEDLPDFLIVTAGDSEEDADLVIELLADLLVIEDKTGFEKRQRSSIMHPQYDYQGDDTDTSWDVILHRGVINKIAYINSSYIPEHIKRKLYKYL